MDQRIMILIIYTAGALSTFIFCIHMRRGVYHTKDDKIATLILSLSSWIGFFVLAFFKIKYNKRNK